MGRHAYLTRLAFGRSAYEPPEQSSASEEALPIEEGPDSITDITRSSSRTQENAELYEPPPQQYNERGHPINPQSRGFARDMRLAQNDVLAAVGVCIRNTPAEEENTLSREDMENNLESEELWGSMISLFGVIIKQSSVWWIGGLRDRIVVYQMDNRLTFTEVIAEEYRRSRFAPFFFAGAPLYYTAIFFLDEEEWADFALNAAHRVIAATVSSGERRHRLKDLLSWIRPAIVLAAEALTSPALLHMTLQGLHLTQHNLFFPPLRAFIPFSPLSPFRRTPFPTSLTLGGLGAWAFSLTQSPILMIWLYRHALVNAHGWLFHAFRYRILRPSNPETKVEEEYDDDEDDSASEEFAIPFIDVRRLSFLDRALGFLGWNTPQRAIERSPQAVPMPPTRHRQSISIPIPQGEILDRVSNNALEPTVTTPTQPMADRGFLSRQSTAPNHPNATELPNGHSETHSDQQDSITHPPHPQSPTSTIMDDIADPADASIRIASSDTDTGAVSLEIALPDEASPPDPATLTPGRRSPEPAGTEAETHHAQREASRPGHEAGRAAPAEAERKSRYRVTDLSVEPAEMLSYVVADCLASWILLPARMMILWKLARTYAGPESREMRPPFLIMANGSLGFPGLKDLPLVVGRVALCCAFEGLICAGFWGLECGIVTVVGKKWFGWKYL